MSEQEMPARIALSERYIDERLERILRAAGSSLRHYMPGSKEELRRTMRQLLEEASAQATEARHD
jgi:hypothetical protein